jgi:hypothetical protein
MKKITWELSFREVERLDPTAATKENSNPCEEER